MKTIITLFLFMVMTLGHTNASNTPFLTENGDRLLNENSSEWVLMKKEKGIETYLKIVRIDDQNYLSIKFKNTSENTVSFSWEVTKKDNIVMKGFNKIELDAGQVIEVFDPTVQQFNYEESSIKECKITIK